jgi:hypothetical protein
MELIKEEKMCIIGYKSRHRINGQKGFAVLMTTVILSIASIAYTTNMAYLQLMDNKVLGNYYRNNEAFLNAETGINLILNKLSSVSVGNEMISNLPFVYPNQLSSDTPYQVTVTELGTNQLSISSVGYSMDGTALRNILLAVDYQIDFATPPAALISNGKINVSTSDLINDGCEGVSASACRSPANIAEQIIISHTDTLEKHLAEGVMSVDSEWCIGDLALGNNHQNNIDLTAIQGDVIDAEGDSRFSDISNNEWESPSELAGDMFSNINNMDYSDNSASLFESTFGTAWENVKQQFATSESVAHVDMTGFNAMSCSEQLQNIDDDTAIIYIEGDCDIASHSLNTGDNTLNDQFTIGSTADPKMVLMEGGTFTSNANIDTSIIGMLYMMPETETIVDSNGNPVYIEGIKQIKQALSVDLSGINVNGSLLSDYHCSASKQDNLLTDTQQSFSIRYGKQTLNKLYQNLGMIPSAIHYQYVVGSWRDF